MNNYSYFKVFLLSTIINTTSLAMQSSHEKIRLSDFALGPQATKDHMEKMAEKSASMTERYLTSRHDLLFDNAFGYTHKEIPSIVTRLSHRYQMKIPLIHPMTREEMIRIHHLYHIINPDCCNSCCQ